MHTRVRSVPWPCHPCEEIVFGFSHGWQGRGTDGGGRKVRCGPDLVRLRPWGTSPISLVPRGAVGGQRVASHGGVCDALGDCRWPTHAPSPHDFGHSARKPTKSPDSPSPVERRPPAEQPPARANRMRSEDDLTASHCSSPDSENPATLGHHRHHAVGFSAECLILFFMIL